nr:hypothetical protein [Clostridia bacterium]
MLRARAAGYAKKLSALLLCGAVCLLAACGGAVSASPTNTPIQAKATMAPTAPPSASPAVTPETTHAL